MKGDGTFFLNNGIGNASTSNVLFYNTSTGQVSYGALSGIQGVQGTSGTGIQGNIGAQGTSGGGEESCL